MARLALVGCALVGLLATAIPLQPSAGLADAAESGSKSGDPRIELVQLRISHDLPTALARVEAELQADPQKAAALGFPYLRAHLLSLLGQGQPAARFFEEAITASPPLAAHARLRLAEWYLGVDPAGKDAVGKGLAGKGSAGKGSAGKGSAVPEGGADRALGFLVDLLTQSPPRNRVGPALDLVEIAVSQGADCAPLARLSKLRLGKSSQRRLDLGRGICAGQAGDAERERELLLRLLTVDTGDDVALHAADRLAEGLGPHPPKEQAAELFYRLGLAYHHHREFERAIPLLERALKATAAAAREGISQKGRAGSLSTSELYDCRYALARSHFWLGRYRIAAQHFAALAAETSGGRSKSRALYQRARCFELIGRESWPQAFRAFGETRDADPRGGFASASTIARLRLAWLMGREQEALGELEVLVRGRKASEAARSLVFLASSDLATGRADRAGAWLKQAESFKRLEAQEVDFWHGRVAEAEGRPEAAVASYLEAWVEDPHHPFGLGAGRRLRADDLHVVAVNEARARASSTRLDQLHAAWLVLGDGDPDGRRARDELRRRLEADARARPFLELSPVPAEQWPIWKASLVQPDERLLALGIFEEGGSRVLRHFPVTEADLAYTGGMVLAQAGATRRSLYIAEILGKRMPDDLPLGLVPESYRQLLHPFRYSYLVLRETGKRDVDPYLLAAIIREESRYDPDAFSGASARGLTQFVYPTARQIAERIELGAIEARDIHRPEIAIALGAGYLEQLAEDFDGTVEHMVAAYNAGEPQARLWRAYSLGDEPEEYLSKVAFEETRNYLRKVLRSRAHYQELYQRPSAPTQAPEPAPAPP